MSRFVRVVGHFVKRQVLSKVGSGTGPGSETRPPVIGEPVFALLSHGPNTDHDNWEDVRDRYRGEPVGVLGMIVDGDDGQVPVNVVLSEETVRSMGEGFDDLRDSLDDQNDDGDGRDGTVGFQ